MNELNLCQSFRFLSLFSGIEACSVAWQPLGWECVGFSEIEPFPCALLFEQESLSRDNPPSREAGQNPTANAQNGVGEICYGLDTQQPPARISKEISQTLTASSYKEPVGIFVPTVYPINTMTCQGRPSDNGRMGIGLGRENDPSPTLSTAHSHAVAYTIHADPTPKVSENVSGTLRSQGGGGIVPPNVVYGFDPRYQNGSVELVQTLTATDYKDPKCVGVIAGNIIGRGDGAGGNGAGVQEDISYTLTATDRHAIITDFVVRRLTPVECERLQGFPDDYTNIPYKGKPAPNSPRYKALGNSMAVPVMRWIGERIVWALNQSKINLE